LLFGLHDPDGQLIEYTQYLPGSLHSNDAGKHLGDPIAPRHLCCLKFPATKMAEVEAFYVNKLGFEEVTKDAAILRLSGDSYETIQLASGSSLGVTFEVPDLLELAANLHQRGIKVTNEGDQIAMTDPDGVSISFVSATPRRKF
jgi:hypothetical protein